MNDAGKDIPADFRHAELFGEDIAAELYANELIDRLYDAGCRLLAKGLPALPINGKSPCIRSGKPMRAWQRVKCDAARLRRGLKGARDPKPSWKNRQADAGEPGIGLRMGPGSVIDIETDSTEEVRAVKHLFRGVPMPKTVTYTSDRGRHILFRYDPRLATLGKDVFRYRSPDGNSVYIRIGGKGQYVKDGKIKDRGAQSVIPPSPGREYLPGCSFDEIEPAALPDVVIERLLEQAPPALIDSEDAASATSAESRSASPVAPLCHPPCSLPSLEPPYDNLNNTSVDKAINDAVKASVPTQYRKRHECIFVLVRRLKAIAELQWITRAWLETPEGEQWLYPILGDWYARGKRLFRGDYDECLDDFLRDWDSVKYPWGHKLDAAYQQSLSEELPADVIKRLGIFDCDNNRRLLQLMAVLQRSAGDKPFPLDGRACGLVLGISQQSVSTKLNPQSGVLSKLGLVEQTRKGERGHASEYRLPWAQHGVQDAGAAHRSELEKPLDSEAA